MIRVEVGAMVGLPEKTGKSDAKESPAELRADSDVF
jgi:hypothetical protein